jgi:quercetin dioxygenase-like cupin family protein
MQQCKVNFDGIAWVSPMAGVRFKAFVRDGRRIRLIEYSKSFIEQDWCPRGHIGYVLEGEFEIDFADGCLRYKPGDGIFLPAGEACKHKARMISDAVRVVLVEDVQA